MKCANCGNTNETSLWDEGDTIYCSRCTHRTRVDTGEDDLVICPVCNHLRDRKALYCQWCNSSWGCDEYDPEAEKLAEEFAQSSWSDSDNYRNIRNK